MFYKIMSGLLEFFSSSNASLLRHITHSVKIKADCSVSVLIFHKTLLGYYAEGIVYAIYSPE